MPKAKKEVVAVAGAKQAPSPKEKKVQVESVDILKADGDSVHAGHMYVRTYSRDVHGDNFEALAQQLVSKYPSMSVIDSSEVTEVIVAYREKEDFEKPINEQKADAPFVDKERSFQDKQAALDFNLSKKGTIKAVLK